MAYGFLDLSFVLLVLLLQFLYHVSHAVLTLLSLVQLQYHFLQTTILLPLRLLCVDVTVLLRFQLRLQLAHLSTRTIHANVD